MVVGLQRSPTLGVDVHMALRNLPTDDGSIDTDEEFGILSNERRRVALHALDDDGPMAESELVDVMTRHEYGAAFEPADRKRMQVSWVQSHAPRLEESGVIVRNDENVSLGPNADQVLRHIRESGDTSLIDLF